MKGRKRFDAGETVLVQRHSSGGAWEPAVYVESVQFGDSIAGNHRVKLPEGAERHIIASGIEVEEGTPGAWPTRNLIVPARRIRRGVP